MDCVLEDDTRILSHADVQWFPLIWGLSWTYNSRKTGFKPETQGLVFLWHSMCNSYMWYPYTFNHILSLIKLWPPQPPARESFTFFKSLSRASLDLQFSSSLHQEKYLPSLYSPVMYCHFYLFTYTILRETILASSFILFKWKI